MGFSHWNVVAVCFAVSYSAGHMRIFGVVSSLDMTEKIRNIPTLLAVGTVPAADAPFAPADSCAPPLIKGTFIGYWSWLSRENVRKARPTCLRLLTQLIRWARALARASAGSNIAARMAIIAMTTNNSIRVKAANFLRRFFINETLLVFCLV